MDRLGQPRRRHQVLSPLRRPAGHDGRQVSQGDCCISRAVVATLARLEIHQDVLSLLHHAPRDNKDDTLLGALADAFAAEGIVFHPATDFAPELLVKAGQIAGRPPSAAQQTDIEFGWDIAKQMGGLDIGQSVCVKDRAVLAVEAIEGTDACILRAGELCKKGGFTVVKVAKPQQDMRFDVPTVGVRTLRTMVAAGAKVLAIEGGRTILLDDDEFRQFAAYHKLSVIALPDRTAAWKRPHSRPAGPCTTRYFRHIMAGQQFSR